MIIRRAIGLCALCLVPFVSADRASVSAEEKGKPSKEALERAREQTKMLDDLYKTAVVGITNTYVEKQSDKPAAMVAIALFDAMKKKGWHNARLVDASDDPKNADNVAKTEFEKKAVKAMQAGKKTLEEIAEVDGKPVLRTATLVPAVLASCARCHGVKEGDVLGTIVYELPIK